MKPKSGWQLCTSRFRGQPREPSRRIEPRWPAGANPLPRKSYLASHPDVKVVIGGYCDERGSNEYNLALGQNRADAARNALITAGVAAGRIRVVSYGKEKPFCSESSESCWQ